MPAPSIKEQAENVFDFVWSYCFRAPLVHRLEKSMRIYYSPLLKMHIDLDSISAIGDAELDEPNHSVGFDIHLKLHDNPLRYARELAPGWKFHNDAETNLRCERMYRREDQKEYIRAEDGTWHQSVEFRTGRLTSLAERRLQTEIEVLVAEWTALSG